MSLSGQARAAADANMTVRVMSSPLIPPPLEALRHRPFSFYPAILNIEHNQWQYRRATWSEALVVNSRTGQEVWIQRRFLGEISRTEDPVVIVGLLKELEYKDGAVLPYQRRVIEMPLAVGASAPPPAPRRDGPAPVVGIRLEPKSDSHVLRFVGGALVLGVVTAYVAVNFYRDAVLRPRVHYIADHYPDLTAQDDYSAVVRKLGPPARDHWEDIGGVRVRSLWYPGRSCTVILMAAPGNEAAYIGTLSAGGEPVNWVRHSVNGASESLLRSLTSAPR